MKPLNSKQLSLLQQIADATDGITPLQRSGAANINGLCVTGASVSALERRGLVSLGGYSTEADGDGFTVRENVPWWKITSAGREALKGAKQP